jgi:hypothetical protein
MSAGSTPTTWSPAIAKGPASFFAARAETDDDGVRLLVHCYFFSETSRCIGA